MLPDIKDIKALLEEFYKKNVEILQSQTKLLTAPGENYGSVMLAVDLTIKISEETVKKQLVAKLCPPNEKLFEMFDTPNTFKKELYFYTQAIPALAEFEKHSNINENKLEEMFAKCFGGRISLNPTSNTVDEDAVILLENLKVFGYDIGDRLTGFDLDHAELIIKNLAEFHAVPIAFKMLKPSLFEEKVKPALKKLNLGFGLPANEVEFMISEVEDVLKTNEKCLKYLKKIRESMEYNLSGPYRSNEGREPFATIVHTDYWVNNTMVLRDSSGKPISNKIVDLQLPIYGSGVHDLLFFIFTSITSSVLQGNIEYFIKLYHNSFIKRLSRFITDISLFSWEAFSEEIVLTAPLEIGHILAMFKPILTERGKIQDMAGFDESFIYRKDIVSKDFESKILYTALSFIERNWI